MTSLRLRTALGGALLLPVLFLFGLAALVTALDGHLLSLNILYGSPLWYTPVLTLWVLVLPSVAVALILAPSLRLLRSITLGPVDAALSSELVAACAVLAVGLSVVAFVFGHDAVPLALQRLAAAVPDLF